MEPDLILTVGGTLAPAVRAPGPSAAEDSQGGSPDAGGPSPAPAHSPAAAPPGLAPPGAPGPAAGPGSPVGPVLLDASPPPGRPGAAWPAVPPGPDHDLLARWARDYASGRPGQQITILYAGCVTATSDLGALGLQAEGFDISVSMIEDDQPVTRAAVAASAGLARCTVGDLRTAPVPPRSYDLVLSSFVLDRVSNAELVLDRLTAAIKPGGLLFLSIHDRDSAAGFLDRALPEPARRLIWRARCPGQPGPHPAVYEPLSSARGVHAYAQLRGLVVAEWRPLRRPGRAGPAGFLAAQHAVSWLSRGRLTAAHEDVLYILRKPEDRFARVL
ncbi:MAG: class I SAM-dependent methyltransferase [Gemmatimonadota bacterium]